MCILAAPCLNAQAPEEKTSASFAKSIVDQVTGEEPAQLEQPEKNSAAVALGRLGGLKGGAARAKN